jgi:hypothetical protein
MKTFLIILFSFLFISAYSQLNTRKNDNLLLFKEYKIDSKTFDIKPKKRFKEDNTTKNVVLIGGVGFATILTINHFSDYRKENNTAYFGLIGALTTACVIVIIIK